MSRFTMIAFATLALTPLTPLGCPPSKSPEEIFLDRDTLAVTAEADPVFAEYGGAVGLRAAATSPEGAVYFTWLQIAGPGVAIEAADSAEAAFQTPSLPGDETLSFMVTARDDAGAVGRAEVSVQIAADPLYGQHESEVGRARANAGPDQTVLPGATVTLSGTSSVGRNLVYRWRQISGPSVSLAGLNSSSATFVAPAYSAGNNIILFELTVTDGAGHVMTDRVQITIKDPNAVSPRVTISTNQGDIVVELNEEKAPITVRNFLRYVDDGFYDGTIFHRVVENFVIQGGGFTPELVEKDTRNPIALEANNGLHNERGTIAMARTGEPNSATSQFFINLKNNVKDGDGLANLDPGGVDENGYAVFGKVVSGMTVVDQIAGVETHSESGFDDVPVEDIIITGIRRVQGAPTGGASDPTSETNGIKGDTQ